MLSTSKLLTASAIAGQNSERPDQSPRNEATFKASTALHPLGRTGAPDEVAGAIRWFLLPEQSWVTGEVLGVDGG